VPGVWELRAQVLCDTDGLGAARKMYKILACDHVTEPGYDPRFAVNETPYYISLFVYIFFQKVGDIVRPGKTLSQIIIDASTDNKIRNIQTANLLICYIQVMHIT